MKHLYLMRHGETLFNVQKRIQGWCDSPLTENGINQAIAARDKIKDLSFDHYYSSPSERCCDTLELVAGDIPYKRLKGLKERNFGTLEAYSEELNVPGHYDDIFPLYGGEYTEDVYKRMNKTLTDIMNKDNHQNVFIVSHGGSIMIFTGYLIHQIPRGFKNCAIAHFTYDGEFHFIEII